jgi:hypothetical protein
MISSPQSAYFYQLYRPVIDHYIGLPFLLSVKSGTLQNGGLR